MQSNGILRYEDAPLAPGRSKSGPGMVSMLLVILGLWGFHASSAYLVGSGMIYEGFHRGGSAPPDPPG